MYIKFNRKILLYNYLRWMSIQKTENKKIAMIKCKNVYTIAIFINQSVKPHTLALGRGLF